MYRVCQILLQFLSKPGYGHAQINLTGMPSLRSCKTISAAQMSTPLAIPEINTVKLSSSALQISFFSSSLISRSGLFSFSGLCPVKQQRCILFSFSVMYCSYEQPEFEICILPPKEVCLCQTYRD